MKNIVVKLLEPVIMVLIVVGVLLIIALNYFTYLQFISVNIINLFVGLLMVILQLSMLMVGAGLALLAAAALKKYLAD